MPNFPVAPYFYDGPVDWDVLGGAVAGSIFLFMVFSARSIVLGYFSSAMMALTGFLLLAKPWRFPLQWTYSDMKGAEQVHAFGYTSETHLFFVVPGAIILALSAPVLFSAVGRTWNTVRRLWT